MLKIIENQVVKEEASILDELVRASTRTKALTMAFKLLSMADSTRTASITGTTGRASNSKAGSIEQNLCTANGSSQSNITYHPSHQLVLRTARS
jgi:hypothetical protein